VQGKTSSHASTISSIQSPNYEKRRRDIFHISVVTKNTKFDSLIDIGSQVNIISEEVVKKLGLDTKADKNHYPLS
jgi:hypothetical protein